MSRFPVSTAAAVTVVLSLMVAEFGCEVEGSKVLLVSMDGFRWDYLDTVSGLDNFARLRKEKCNVGYVKNVFATTTFPSHYSIVTGLYEETHGIVADYMYDPVRNATFTKTSKEPFWWNGGEPIWVTAVRQGKRSGVFNWPGCEVEIRGYRPTNYSNYTTFNPSVPPTESVDTVLDWFLEPDLEKDVALLYLDQPDSFGHEFGPHAPQTVTQVKHMDDVLGMILRKLDEKNLTDIVNVILTSDHGMTEVNAKNRTFDLWQYVNTSIVAKVPDSGAVTAILPVEGREAEVMSAVSKIPHMTAYRKEDMPDHFHYKHNDRIMPIIIIAEEGWLLAEDYGYNLLHDDKGDHGYSNEFSSMHPIFFAWGPDIRTGVRKTSVNMLDIYPLMCHLLNITAAPNNGSLDNMADFLVRGAPTQSACQNVVNWLSLGSLMVLSLRVIFA